MGAALESERPKRLALLVLGGLARYPRAPRLGGGKEKFDGGSTGWREVEFADPAKTTSGESARRGLARRPRTKVGVSITIRDRSSPNHKLC